MLALALALERIFMPCAAAERRRMAPILKQFSAVLDVPLWERRGEPYNNVREVAEEAAAGMRIPSPVRLLTANHG